MQKNGNKGTINLDGEIYTTGIFGSTGGGKSDLNFNCRNGAENSGKIYLAAGHKLDEKFTVDCTTNIISIEEDSNSDICDCKNPTTYDCMLSCPDIVEPLPVSLTEFVARVAASVVYVNWKTASETNNDFFTLLRSHNGSQFNEIATIAGMGNTVEPQQYEYIDKNPLAGLSYYRLSQTDFDGTTTMHNIVPVFYNTIPESFSAFTYRLNGIASLQLQFATSESTNTVRVYSIMGELQFEETIAAGISAYTIDAPLQAGVYIVTNTCNNITSSIKVLIQ